MAKNKKSTGPKTASNKKSKVDEVKKKTEEVMAPGLVSSNNITDLTSPSLVTKKMQRSI